MKILRRYIRHILSETRFKQMSKSKFTDLKQHLENSEWMNVDAGGDYDGEYGQLSSEAQQQLIDDLNDYLDDKFGVGEITLTIQVDMMPTLPDEGYNQVLKSAVYYFDEFGSHNVELMLASMDDGQTLSQLGNVAQKVYEVVTHELLHMQQFLKFSKGNPTIEKWNEFSKSYEDAGGPQEMGNEYFFFDEEASELETFAFQIANELFDALGKDEAIKLLQSQNPDIDIIINNSASVKIMQNRNVDFSRPEFRDMLKRSKQYIKRM